VRGRLVVRLSIGGASRCSDTVSFPLAAKAITASGKLSNPVDAAHGVAAECRQDLSSCQLGPGGAGQADHAAPAGRGMSSTGTIPTHSAPSETRSVAGDRRLLLYPPSGLCWRSSRIWPVPVPSWSGPWPYCRASRTLLARRRMSFGDSDQGGSPCCPRARYTAGTHATGGSEGRAPAVTKGSEKPQAKRPI
jgi:hypothetical protein